MPAPAPLRTPDHNDAPARFPRPLLRLLDAAASGEAHPIASPGREARWPALWSARDALLTLAVLGQLLLLQTSLVAMTRGGAGFPFGAALALALFPSFATAATVVLSARSRGLSASQLGFVRPRSWRPIVIAWLVAVFAGPLTHWSSSLWAASGSTSQPFEAFAAAMPAQRLGYTALLAIVLGMLVPLVEEVIFRGVIHRSLRTRWPLFPAAILSGLVFAAVHLDVAHVAPLFMVGFILAWSYERSGSLWGAIIPHGGLNALTVLVIAIR